MSRLAPLPSARSVSGRDGGRAAWPTLTQRIITLLLLVLAALASVLWPVPAAAQANPPPAALSLTAAPGEHDMWPHTALLDDPGGQLGLDQVLARLAAPAEAAGQGGFGPVGQHGANLGRRAGAVWLRTVISLPAGDDSHWLLALDYPPLDQVEAWLLEGEAGSAPARVLQHAVMGDHQPWAHRPRPTRAHVLALDLPERPATPVTRVLLMRVQTTGSMILPMAVQTAERYELHEAREQALQGLIAGVGLLLLIYSLAQWAALGEHLFGAYALALLGHAGFFAALSGVGPQHLWSGSDWFTRNAPPLTILLGVGGALSFVHQALGLGRQHPRAGRLVQASAALALGVAVGFALGWPGYAAAQAVGMALVPLPLLVVVPIAWRHLRQGERAAGLMLLGWGLYALGALTMVAMLAGVAPVGFWSLHAFQFASLAEMLIWLVVLAQRVLRVHDQARQLQGDRDRLHSLAHTDALTGLLNRRGLQEAWAARQGMGAGPGLVALPRSCLAVYVMDLDGFKPVNDRLGHAAGDALLVAVAQCLRSQVRASDLLCRLGGDEFVLVAGPFVDEADAARVAQQVLRAFDQPFELEAPAGARPTVGVTIGYALAPQDGRELDQLLRRADLALYAGKQAGRHQARRAGAELAVPGGVARADDAPVTSA